MTRQLAVVLRAETSAHAAFARARKSLEDLFDQDEYRAWIEPLRLVGMTNGALVFVAPNSVVRDRVRNYVQHKLERLLGEQMPLESPIQVTVASELPAEARELAAAATPIRSEVRIEAAPEPSAQHNTFESFCVGASNAAAHLLAQDVARGEAQAFPLVMLHGPPGVVKTHLMQAVAHEAARVAPHRRVRLMMAQIFIAAFQAALSNRKDMSAFKALVRENDLLLIDDVHRIAGKRATEEEFLDTVAVVMSLGGQVVVSADHGPQGLQGFDERLRNQLRGATDCALGMPDFELRRRIVEMRAGLYRATAPQFALPPEVTDLIAARMAVTGRELDGAVRQLLMAHREGAPLTLAEAEQRLKHKFSEPEKRPTIELIIKTTARSFGLTPQQLLSRTRQQAIARPRQVAMYLACHMTTRSLPHIGKRFGNFDHTTVLYARERVPQLMEKDPAFRAEVEDAMRAVREAL